MADTTNIQYSLSITLLEDLHSGTGTGNVTVDSVQARNNKGFPIIDRHHFRGVMKDNALRLEKLKAINNDDINSLFGKGGNLQRKLDCSSLTATKKDCIIYWDATARQKNSRCPEENSLRRFEYIKAGTLLKGTVTLRNVSQGEVKAFRSALKFTTRLGAERTRGSGQIKIVIDKETRLPKKIPDSNAAITTNTLKILITNSEPLCIPKSGHAGNIIRSESHIPGRTLFAALANIAHKSGGDSALKNLFNQKLHIGNAYPIPSGYEKQNLEKLLSIPMPNQIHSIKQEAISDEVSPWPHWAKPQTEIDLAPELDDNKNVNLFIQEEKEEKENKTERPKGEVYLIRDEEGKWRRYRQPMTIRMRNLRGDPFAKKQDGTLITRKDTELFSEQRIAENTFFICEIQCEDHDLLKMVSNYLNQALMIGRGKAPIKTEQQICINPNTPSNLNSGITITATSDWILRGKNLGYLTQLNKEMLGLTFGIGIDINDITLDAYQETETQGSFNYASGLPKRPFEVIRRGSSFKLSGDPDKINALFNKLRQSKKPIGERLTEGYGQYVINLPVELTAHNELEAQKESKKQAASEQALEEKKAAIEQKMNICQTYFKECKQRSTSPPPDKEKWQSLKKDILENTDNTPYQNIVSSFANDTGFLFIYTDQKTSNLGKTLDNLIKEIPDADKQAKVKGFIECFELHLYPEGAEQ